MKKLLLFAACLLVAGCKTVLTHDDLCRLYPPACAPSPAPSATPSPEATPTPAPSATPAPAPTPQPTPVPTPRPSPSATPEPPGGGDLPSRLPLGHGCTLPIARLGLGDAGTQGEKHNYQFTFRFGPGNGKPCDGSHLACNDPNYHGVGQCEPCDGSVCEDPRGGAVTAGGGTVTLNSVENGIPPYGYAAQVKGHGGWIKVCVPPSPYSRDGSVPLKVTQQCESVKVP